MTADAVAIMASNKPRLLLIEDEVSLAESTCELLSLMGYAVDWADSPTKAFTAMVQVPYEAALLDLNLGPERGEDLVMRLRASGHRIPPLIILSARSIAELKLAAVTVGAAAVLQKPCSLAKLKTTIEKVLQASPASSS